MSRDCVSVGSLFDAALDDLGARVVVENPTASDFDEALRHLGYKKRDRAWIEKFYSLIYFCLANRVGCLDFLDGVRGRARAAELGEASVDVREFISDSLANTESYLRAFDWEGGKVTIRTAGKDRVVRIGKLLRQHGAPKDLVKEFETRTVELEWVITADPREVAAMSYGRAWTSCMRPHGLHEVGPLSDVMAGSALLLFFRPGSDKPCGREILRPATDDGDEPVIVRPGVTYGTAAVLDDDDLEEAIQKQTGIPLPVWTESLRRFSGIFSGVYDDHDRHSFEHWSADKMLEAADALGESWGSVVELPPPLDVSAMEEPTGPVETGDAQMMADAREIARLYLDEWHLGDSHEATPPASADAPPEETPEGFSKDIWAEAWAEVVNEAKHTFLVVAEGQPEYMEDLRVFKVKDPEPWGYWRWCGDVLGAAWIGDEYGDQCMIAGIWMGLVEVANATAANALSNKLRRDRDVLGYEIVMIG